MSDLAVAYGLTVKVMLSNNLRTQSSNQNSTFAYDRNTKAPVLLSIGHKHNLFII